ncbi:MAG: hypothetical protein AAFP82_18680 [Bacteroidota bacterium]
MNKDRKYSVGLVILIIIEIILFIPAFPGTLSTLILTQRILCYGINHKEDFLKIQKMEYTQGRRALGSHYITGMGETINNNIKTKVNLRGLDKIGIADSQIKDYLIEHDSIVPIWTTKKGKGSIIRHENNGQPYDWRSNYLDNLGLALLLSLPFFIIDWLRKKIEKKERNTTDKS